MWGNLSALETAELLKSRPTGTYLLRFSTSVTECFTLTVFDGTEVRHWRLSVTNTADMQGIWLDNRYFSSIAEFTEAFRRAPLPGGLDVRLSAPLIRHDVFTALNFKGTNTE
jgi:hypothetical protein